jgi:hypothetical protein
MASRALSSASQPACCAERAQVFHKQHWLYGPPALYYLGSMQCSREIPVFAAVTADLCAGDFPGSSAVQV